MSDKSAIAESLLKAWGPACERIEVAGSVRRGRTDPHDIEIVAIPRLQVVVAQRDMFGDAPILLPARTLFDELLSDWKADGRLRDRSDRNGRPAWGLRFKRAALADGTAVDIFSVLPPAQWGVIFAIRTGPADFSHALVTSRLEGGLMPVGMQVKGGVLWRQGQALTTPEEEDFFRELGLPCWPPAERGLLPLVGWRRRQRDGS